MEAATNRPMRAFNISKVSYARNLGRFAKWVKVKVKSKSSFICPYTVIVHWLLQITAHITVLQSTILPFMSNTTCTTCSTLHTSDQFWRKKIYKLLVTGALLLEPK